MESTVRWHTSNCSRPSVIVVDGVPRCQSCDATSSAFVERLVAQNQAKGAEIHLPPEAPLGEANLWWPPSVPYCSPEIHTSKDRQHCNNEAEATMLSEKDTEQNSISHVYPSSLDSSHFRLIYITESEGVTSPIHIRLEEYSLDDRPEYETVSYVWGGEKRDSTACKPVYVGSFWDVILATKNCAALLHYLRPQRGCRVIWLDAICINQANNIEKQAQISIMGDIYTDCERVVAYFGEDLVSRPPGRSHRSRINSQKLTFTNGSSSRKGKIEDFFKLCADGAGISRDQLLSRRYLTRIWIVQELLLSKKAMFPLGVLDILCDREHAKHLVLKSSEERLDISDVDWSLTHLLQLTAHCDASDLRDRVYGLLGLFKPEKSSERLTANYTLSWRDCWVGTAAYLLLVERNFHLLIHALGNNRRANLPSWVPDILNTKSWESARSWLHRMGKMKFSEAKKRPIGYRSTAYEKWVTEFEMYSVPEVGRNHYYGDLETDGCWEKQSQQLFRSNTLYTGSLESATVDSSNGALQLKALRIFDSPCRLTTETEENGLTSIWVRGPSTAAHFCTMGLNQPVAPDEHYQLFIFGEHSGHKPMLLALTTALSENDNSVVAIHHCLMVYDVRFYSMDHFEASTGRTDLTTNNLYSLFDAFTDLHGSARIGDRLVAVVEKMPEIFDCIFPSYSSKTRDLLPLVRRLLEVGSLSGESPTLAESISSVAERICPDFDPFIQDNYFHLTIKNEKMWREWAKGTRINHRSSFREYIEVSLNYSDPLIQDTEKWNILDFDETNSFWDGPVLPVTLRFSLDPLLQRMKDTAIFKAMCRVRDFSILLNEDLETLMFRDPTPDDSCVFLEGWGRGLVDELGLVWKLERITIR